MTGSIVVYNPYLAQPICLICKHAVKFDGVMLHMKRLHSRSRSDGLQMEDLLREQQRSNESESRKFTKMREKYMATTTNEYRSGPVLPYLEVLSVQDCHKCPHCGYMAPKADSVRRNCASSDKCGREVYCDLLQVKGQTIFAGNKRKYFQIPAPIDEKCTDILLDSMNNLRGATPSRASTEDADISEMNSLLSIFRFDAHLARYNISLSDAVSFRRFDDKQSQSFFRDLIAVYHKKAFDITEKKPYVKSHMFMGDYLSIAISPKTVNIYDDRVTQLLSFIVNVISSRPALDVFHKSIKLNRRRGHGRPVQALELETEWGFNKFLS